MHSLQLVLVDAILDEDDPSLSEGPAASLGAAEAEPGVGPLGGVGRVSPGLSPGLVELPACAVCLDRLDGSVSGVAGPGVCVHGGGDLCGHCVCLHSTRCTWFDHCGHLSGHELLRELPQLRHRLSPRYVHACVMLLA